ncbi:VraH family peptide resistance protein [Mammaliicoccus sp. Dog046]|uniref:VraH family peptide resistance protein n=1 Tax=Mammaliicoccus sp. Dog046 TaxID=3034233 RepID=UPI002B2645CF|nr:VraH family protein [Mammaliicoccus sp. Dog046]WQK85216.1 VraH family protein [Mammaliicoccus sp. Dog046]
MKIKDVLKKSFDDLLDLELNKYNIAVLAVAALVLSSIFTPIFGIPAGLLGGAYYLKNYKS